MSHKHYGVGIGTTIFGGSPRHLLKTDANGLLASARPLKSVDVMPNDNSQHFLEVVGTLPAVPSGSPTGVDFHITTAGSAAQSPTGVYTLLDAGYTGSAPTTGLWVDNGVAGTAASFQGSGNIGIFGEAYAVTSGINYGLVGLADEGSINIGVEGLATFGNVGSTDIGVVGMARSDSGPGVGGYFSLRTSGTPPTITSAALVADNDTTTDPIARFRNNGVDQVIIGDSGGGVDPFLRVVGTLPANGVGVMNELLTSGSGNISHVGIYNQLGGGSTGTNYTIASYNYNYGNSTGAGPWNGSAAYGAWNEAGPVGGPIAGSSVGTASTAYARAKNYASFNYATFGTASSVDIGVAGLGRNTAGGTEIGGYFALNGTVEPTWASTALLVDNSDRPRPIALFRNNGVDQVKIGDGVPNDNSQHFLEVVGTLPSSPSTFVHGVRFDVTSAGSVLQQQHALLSLLHPGYTGAASTFAMRAGNETAGTSFNTGLDAYAEAITAGKNVGVQGSAYYGDQNIGVYGWAYADATKADTEIIGVLGETSGSGTGTTRVGGWFRSTGGSFIPAASAALIADNMNTTDPIALFRNNGVDQVKIGDGVPNDNSQHFLEVVGTLPASPSGGFVSGIDMSVTSAGTVLADQYAQRIRLLPGYTGSANTYALSVSNEALGAANDLVGALGNYGLAASASGLTTGLNAGAASYAWNGDLNIGSTGQAILAKNAATNIGGAFFGRNTGTGSIEIGLYAGLTSSNPTFESGALIADNGITSRPIFLARDNGTTVWSIQDSGHVYAKVGTKTLTESTPTAFVRISIPQGTTTAGLLKYAVEAADASNFQARSGVLSFSLANKAGTESAGLSTPSTATESFVETSGASTLSNAFTASSSVADTMDLLANATSSLTQTTLRINYTLTFFGNANVSVTPL